MAASDATQGVREGRERVGDAVHGCSSRRVCELELTFFTMAAPVSTPVFAIRDDDGVRLMVDEHGAAPSLVTMPARAVAVAVPPAVANCASMMLPDGRPVASSVRRVATRDARDARPGGVGHRGRRHRRRRVELKL